MCCIQTLTMQYKLSWFTNHPSPPPNNQDHLNGNLIQISRLLSIALNLFHSRLANHPTEIIKQTITFDHVVDEIMCSGKVL